MTILSNDRMADVFPVVFDFKKGEQPSSAKLTKWVQLTDSAFGLITRAVGDPWDCQRHAGTINPLATLALSPLKLGQPTLARSIGPSEYVGPLGESMNAGVSDPLEVTLNINGISSWFFGFPFVKTTGTVGPQTLGASFQLLTSADFVFGGDLGLTAYFTTFFDDPRALTEKGDYYIDFANGIIQTATPIDPADALLTTVLTVTISSLSYIGAGPPWSTHNVIPSWTDDLNTGISIVEGMAGPGFYDITLPEHSSVLPRVGKPADAPSATMTGSGYSVKENLMAGGNQTTFVKRPTEGVSYQLPYAIVESFEDGDVFPDGVVLLWNNTIGDLIALTEFEYVDETHLTLTCPVLSDVTSTPNITNYRLIITGTSLAEQVGYLSAVVRDNPGQGLAYGALASFPSVTYSPAISHDRLRDRFSMSGAREATWANFTAEFESWQKRFAFAESHVPTNPHPQYMHRAGWMAQDKTGNSGNAMRGELVFTSRPDPYTGAGTDVLDLGGQLWDTWGIRFGGGPDDAYTNDRQNTSFSWLGSRYGKGNLWDGEPYDESFANLDLHLNFTNVMTGAAPWNVTGLVPMEYSLEYMYGALGYTPIWNTPLYIRGRSAGTYERGAKGGVIAFDLDGAFEMNYLKLMPADRALWNYAFSEVNMPNPNFSACSRQLPSLPKLETSPDVFHDWHPYSSLGDSLPTYGRWSAGQIREFRFRGVSENSMSMMGHQSIAAGELIEDPSSKIVAIDDMPIVGISGDTALSLVVLDGNYLPHLFPGQRFQINDSTASDGNYFVKWAIYIPNLLTLTVNKTIVKLGFIADGPLTTQLAGGYGKCWTTEMMAKFTSPSILGADYFNVYGNALFFSEGGGGSKTSFTERGSLWLDFGHSLVPYIGDQTPSAIFYHPEDATTSPGGSYYAFTLSETGHPAPNLNGKHTRWPLIIGDNVGIIGQTSSMISLTARADMPSSNYSQFGLTNAGLATLRSYYNSEMALLSLGMGSATFTTDNDFNVHAYGNIVLGKSYTQNITIQQGREGTNTGGFFFFGNNSFVIDTETPNENLGFLIKGRVTGDTYPTVDCWVRPGLTRILHEYSGTQSNEFFMYDGGVTLHADETLALYSVHDHVSLYSLADYVRVTGHSVYLDVGDYADEEFLVVEGIFVHTPGDPASDDLYAAAPSGTVYKLFSSPQLLIKD